MACCIYLRKSRSDDDARRLCGGDCPPGAPPAETLARHERALSRLAAQSGLEIGAVYREVVSGDTISARPVMRRLLSEVGRGLWDGVLVMEVERLARGDTIDQGMVAQTFRYSGTKIITPLKTYDPGDEFDEEYFEFGLFMSRREYKSINRRLQRGRAASAREGKFAGSRAPYGYTRERLPDARGFTLAPLPGQADVVRLIYALYTGAEAGGQRLGATRIAQRLDALRIPPPKGGRWSESTVRGILASPVYAGRIRWNHRPAVRRMEDGTPSLSRPLREDCLITAGLHPAIIPPGTWDLAQECRRARAAAPVPGKRALQNPLAGLIVCGKCGRRMVRRPYAGQGKEAFLICPDRGCRNVGCALSYVERCVWAALGRWFSGYRLARPSSPESAGEDPSRGVAEQARRELGTLLEQQGRIYDLLEQGVYTPREYELRMDAVGQRIGERREQLLALSPGPLAGPPRARAGSGSLPEICAMLPDAASKNRLLREVFEKMVYVREAGGRWSNPPDDFELTLYPKIPARPDGGPEPREST